MEKRCYNCNNCKIIEEEDGYIRSICLDKNRDIMEHRWKLKDLINKYINKLEVKFPQDKSIAKICMTEYLKFHNAPDWCSKTWKN